MPQGNGQIKPLPVLCAGQDCNDRRTCMRYRIRFGCAQWASWDIERSAIRRQTGIDFCPAFEFVVAVKHRK